MAELPLDQGIPRFKQNEDRMDRFINGGETDTFVTSGGTPVPSVRKFLKDKDDEINTEADGILAMTVAAKGAAEAAASAAGTAKTGSETARDKAAEWAESPSAPGGSGTRSAKSWASEAQTSAAALKYEIFDTVAAAQAATLDPAPPYIAIADYAPVPRYFKKVASNPGAVDKLQTANGIWYRGMALPNTTFDFAAPVARAGNVTIGGSDFDLVHSWTISTGTTYTCTLPDPDTYIGRMIHIQVDESSRGLLVIACVDPVGKFANGDLAIWGGESLTLVGRAGKWEIIGGRCKPLFLKATNPGADLSATWVASSGWITDQQGGEEWAIAAAGYLTIPRKGVYQIEFDASVSWDTAPSFVYITAYNNGQPNDRDQRANLTASANAVMHSRQSIQCARGLNVLPVVQWSGGSNVKVARTSISTPQASIIEQPQW